MSSRSVLVPTLIRQAIIDHARRAKPIECCGFVIGTNRRARFVVPMENVANSRIRYRIDARAHIELRRMLRGIRPRLSIIGVYHSHPVGDAWPSRTDVAEAFYPDWMQFIVGFRRRRPVLRAFLIRDGAVEQVPLR